MTNDGRNRERARAFHKRRSAESRQSENPNRGKSHGARLPQRQNPSKVRASKVTTRYMPGKTIDARIAGIRAYYERAAALAQIGA